MYINIGNVLLVYTCVVVEGTWCTLIMCCCWGWLVYTNIGNVLLGVAGVH